MPKNDFSSFAVCFMFYEFSSSIYVRKISHLCHLLILLPFCSLVQFMSSVMGVDRPIFYRFWAVALVYLSTLLMHQNGIRMCPFVVGNSINCNLQEYVSISINQFFAMFIELYMLKKWYFGTTLRLKEVWLLIWLSCCLELIIKRV